MKSFKQNTLLVSCKRYLFLLGFFLLSGMYNVLSGQEAAKVLKSDRDFISLAYNHIFLNNISNVTLDKYIALINGVGDKGLIKDMIIRRWIFNAAQPGKDSSLIDFSQVTFNHKPVITQRFDVDELLRLIAFYIFNEVDQYEHFNLFKEGTAVMDRLRILAPNITDDEEDNTDCIRFYTRIVMQAKAHQDEVDKLTAYFKSNIRSYKTRYPGKDTEEIYRLLKARVLDRHPMLSFYTFDDSVSDCLQEASVNVSAIPDLHKIRDDLPAFVGDIYDRLLSRKPTAEESATWEKYYTQDDAIPGMILYILISSEEYRYF